MNRMSRLAILAALALATLAADAQAQGMYYQEVEKDGRIYVFNLAKEYAAWAKSGEMGKSLTRPGYGPEGKTVVFDSEDAMDLYNFKHGVAEVVERPKKPKMEVTWKDGKTTIATDKAMVQISNRIQSRFTEELPDDSVQPAGTEAAGDAKGSFRIRRAKFKVEGWFYQPWLQFETQLNWPDVTGTPASRFLEDANINWDLTKGKKNLMVRFGQFKVPFGHQELVSSGSQQFVDRSDASLRYARGRETGIALWGALGSSNKVEWRVGAFNGNGRSQAANDNAAYQYNARVVFQPNGAVPLGNWNSGALYSEVDFESADKPIFALAANFERNDKHFSTTSTDTADTILSGDATFKYKRFSAFAEYFTKDADPETGDDFKDKGFYVQAGYLLDSTRQWELAARYGRIDPSDLKSGDDRTEVGGAVSYYYNKHNLKVQADFRQVEDEAANSGQGTKNKEFRLQAQFIF